ncbi:hypothetical protein [uncultured Pontibacter sp.]|uniref:hypothetical protein n=1 Tax=uncultured Pontibacter sp. TaxID=453356 RepID=UPI00262FAA59|nr:hypothetical protein [uncultured Pontibacter sp.]
MRKYENNTSTAEEQQLNTIDYTKNINQGNALAAWWKLAAKYNNSLPTHPVVRTYADGTQKTVYIRKGIITKSVIETGEKLILRYIESYNQARKQGLIEDEAPSLSTNSIELGRLFQTSDRTVRAHLNVLKRPGVGFISQYNFRGTRANYELWISPEILWPGQSEPAKNAQKSSNSQLQNKNLPHIKQPETPETIEKESTHVDKCGVAAQQRALPGGEGAGNTCGAFTSDTGPQEPAKIAVTAPEKPVAAKKPETVAAGAATVEKQARMAIYRTFVENFWAIAWKLVYPTGEFTEYNQRMAKNAIFFGVYRGFSNDWSIEKWESYHLQVVEQLKLVANYYENNPDKHPPLPYAQYKPGTGYFDAENERGFRNTFAWWQRQQVWKKQAKVNDALRRAEKEIRLHKQGVLRDELQRLSPLQMFRRQETKLKRFGKAALDKFYAQHAPQQV